MKTPLFILAIIFSVTQMFGGEMYVVKCKLDADVVAFVVDHAWDADIFVRVTSVGADAQANDFAWKIVNYKLNSTIRLYYTKNKNEADVKVFFSKSFHGWKKPNKFQGRLH